MFDRPGSLRPWHALGYANLLQPRLAFSPSEAFQVIRGGCERVRHAAHQVAAAVAVIVHGELQVVGGRELHLPEFARPGAPHLRRLDVPAIDDAQRVNQLGAEVIRAAAVIGERRQRAKR
jgi:hypothetical protein